jgi:hypothetical protein
MTGTATHRITSGTKVSGYYGPRDTRLLPVEGESAFRCLRRKLRPAKLEAPSFRDEKYHQGLKMSDNVIRGVPFGGELPKREIEPDPHPRKGKDLLRDLLERNIELTLALYVRSHGYEKTAQLLEMYLDKMESQVK